MRMRTLALASMLLVLPACSASHVIVGEHDGGGHRPDAEELCGGFAGLACGDGELCDFPDDRMCGAADGSGTCVPRPTACSRIADPHCGCDGVTYANECVAHAAGVDTLHRGECESPDCAPDDAHGEGLCDAIVGMAWNGRSCVYLSGCSCVGSDCGRYTSREECEAPRAACPVPL